MKVDISIYCICGHRRFNEEIKTTMNIALLSLYDALLSGIYLQNFNYCILPAVTRWPASPHEAKQLAALFIFEDQSRQLRAMSLYYWSSTFFLKVSIKLS